MQRLLGNLNILKAQWAVKVTAERLYLCIPTTIRIANKYKKSSFLVSRRFQSRGNGARLSVLFSEVLSTHDGAQIFRGCQSTQKPSNFKLYSAHLLRRNPVN